MLLLSNRIGVHQESPFDFPTIIPIATSHKQGKYLLKLNYNLTLHNHFCSQKATATISIKWKRMKTNSHLIPSPNFLVRYMSRKRCSPSKEDSFSSSICKTFEEILTCFYFYKEGHEPANQETHVRISCKHTKPNYMSTTNESVWNKITRLRVVAHRLLEASIFRSCKHFHQLSNQAHPS